MNNIYQHNQLKERQSAPQALNNSVPAQDDVLSQDNSKLNVACRSGNTLDSKRPNVGNHTVFVLNFDGKPLTPTTSAKARKLLKAGLANKVWSKFNTFGIQLTEKTREEIPKTTLGVDPGSKYDGYSIVCDKENNLNVKLNLPKKLNLVNKLIERRRMRKNRKRNLRKRGHKFNNRNKKGFIVPSQIMLTTSRLKIISELCRIFPIKQAAIENVKFNHRKYRWGKNFSDIETGKRLIRNWFRKNKIKKKEFKGYQTKKLREKYEYNKIFKKSQDCFESHCSDSLSLAIEINNQKRLNPGILLIVDDTYRPIRRKIHDSNLKKGGIREKYSKGTVFGLKKGLIIGTRNGKIGQLCGELGSSYRYYQSNGKRSDTNKILWINNQFKIKNIIK